MEFYTDLLKRNEKNPLWAFIGLLSFFASFGWLVSKLSNSEPIETFDWFYSAIFALNGLVHTLGGLGYPVEGFMGKAFIKIDDNSIRIKSGILKKEQVAAWDTIQSIGKKKNELVISLNGNSSLTVSFSKLEYSMVKEIKSTLSNLANKKGINIQLQAHLKQ